MKITSSWQLTSKLPEQSIPGDSWPWNDSSAGLCGYPLDSLGSTGADDSCGFPGRAA